jgi:hypothetical protein
MQGCRPAQDAAIHLASTFIPQDEQLSARSEMMQKVEAVLASARELIEDNPIVRPYE